MRGSRGVDIHRQDSEAFPFCSISEPLVDADEFQAARILLGPREGRCQVERIGGSQGMDGEQSLRSLPDWIGGTDLNPGRRESIENVLESFNLLGRERAFPTSSEEGGTALQDSRPPDHHDLIRMKNFLDGIRERFPCTYGNYRRRIPELQRLSSRSSRRALRISPSGS